MDVSLDASATLLLAYILIFTRAFKVTGDSLYLVSNKLFVSLQGKQL